MAGTHGAARPVARRAGELGRRLARAALDVVLPPRCPGCGGGVPRQGELCAGCWTGLRFLGEPLCPSCGRPLPGAATPGAACHACAARPSPLVGRVRSALAYDEASRRLILAFKHGARLEGVGLFAIWMHHVGRPLLEGADLLVPVPLHRWRLLGRGFNQSALLARGVSRLSGVPWAPDLLRRRRATASQQGLSAAQRRRNITAEAFAVAPRRAALLVDKRVVLVDDVRTTGATLEACATVLRQAGAAGVDALTLARVVQGEDDPI